jgi:phage-related protein
MAPKIGKAAGAVVSLPLNVGGNATRFLTRTLKNGSRVIKKVGSRVNSTLGKTVGALRNGTKRNRTKRFRAKGKKSRSNRH